MKVFFLLVGLVFIFIVIAITRYSMRLGKPVDLEKSDNYYHHRWGNKIIYSPMGNWFELGYSEMDADPNTFSVIDREFGKDINAVYWKDKKQLADVATFYVDEKWIPKDRQHAYYLSTSWPDTMTIVPGADPATYTPYMLKEETYNQGWFRDNHAYYLDGRAVEVDYKSFQRLNSALAIDTNHVYITRSEEQKPRVLIAKQKNPGGEARRINDLYARVGSQVLISLWNVELIVLDFKVIDTISVLDEDNIVVNNQLVALGKLVPEVDVASLEILPLDYLRDRQYVFYKGNIIADADPATFEIVHDRYSKDARHVFYQTRILAEADPTKLKMDFAQGTASDGIRTYREGELIK